ncbi:piggyBac transposable element-derived protein 3 [Nephila pilipes]|uniref:PiggyBac transposable element-derived protein 3 n=1 Tax=Nephila pilipes TaxID=299642 RepID=A0A8X6QQY0_NEPPI|nr:piggyBac transposable element-derived protein 3 [Nephila pilipes]
MTRKKVFKTAEEAVEYLFLEELEFEMIVLPPEVDEFTIEEGFDDSETLDPSTCRGSHDFYFDVKNKITAVKWNDNKCITLAKNFDIIEPLTSVSRREKRKGEKNKIEQLCLKNNYNKNMGGIESHDWPVEKHTISIRGKKCNWLIITRIVDMAFCKYLRYLQHGECREKEYQRNKETYCNSLSKKKATQYKYKSVYQVIQFHLE